MEPKVTTDLGTIKSEFKSKTKPTARQYNEASDNLATFLFEQYRKYKEEIEPDRDSKGYIISDMDTNYER